VAEAADRNDHDRHVPAGMHKELPFAGLDSAYARIGTLGVMQAFWWFRPNPEVWPISKKAYFGRMNGHSHLAMKALPTIGDRTRFTSGMASRS
jgi:hypothetical protein